MPTTQIKLDKPMPLPATPYLIERDVQWPELQYLMPTTQIKLDKPMPLPAKRERTVPIQTDRVPNPNSMPITPYLIERNVPMPIQIDRNVPMPAPKRRYPFKLLAIGDSFVIPIAEIVRATSASDIGRLPGDTQRRRFTHRQDKAAGTVRFWRIQ